MPKAVPLNSISFLAASVLLIAGGCARDAPALPRDTVIAPAPQIDAEQRNAECAKLTADIAALRSEMTTIEQVIAGQRHSDQVAGYLSAVLFPPLALAIDQQKARKGALDERQQKIDTDLAQQRALRCPST